MSAYTFALVTGASKGIGKSIAIALAKRKNNLLLVARSENELHVLGKQLQVAYGIQANYLALDLAEPGAAKKVKDWCEQNGYRVDTLVNNAGYGLWGRFDALDLAAQMQMLQLNMLTVVDMTSLFLPELKQHPKAYIMNVASTAAFQAIPTFSLYAASKAFVLSFSRALRYELKNTSVSVTCLCPGPVNTGFVERAGLSFMKNKAERFGTTPDKVAEIAVQAMLEGKTEVIPGFQNRFGVFMIRFLPKSWVEAIAAKIFK